MLEFLFILLHTQCKVSAQITLPASMTGFGTSGDYRPSLC